MCGDQNEQRYAIAAQSYGKSTPDGNKPREELLAASDLHMCASLELQWWRSGAAPSWGEQLERHPPVLKCVLNIPASNPGHRKSILL